MIEYFVISELYLDDLIAEMNDRIRNGWIPQGGIARISVPGEVEYLQAMVR